MGHKSQPLNALAGHADQMKYRQPVRLAAHDPVESRQFAHPVGRGQNCCSTDASVAVGRVRGVELVGAAEIASMQTLTRTFAAGMPFRLKVISPAC